MIKTLRGGSSSGVTLWVVRFQVRAVLVDKARLNRNIYL